jgi:hypothetical protein
MVGPVPDLLEVNVRNIELRPCVLIDNSTYLVLLGSGVEVGVGVEGTISQPLKLIAGGLVKPVTGNGVLAKLTLDDQDNCPKLLVDGMGEGTSVE